MQVSKLHIVSFDVPYPPDYGGVIDIFYKVRSLYEAGVSVFLHCFAYGRAQSAALEKYCAQVWYYPRKTGWRGFSARIPYIIYSRRDGQLLPNLLSVEAPVLFEGVHDTYLLQHPALADRCKLLRNHNVEHQYYGLLANREHHALKRLYFKTEAFLLKKWEKRLGAADVLLPISQADTDFFKKQYPGKKVDHIPGFHPYNQVQSATGKGSYCLYQGNLNHPENVEAALFLLQQVFNDIAVPVIIAGRNPDPSIADTCRQLPNATLVPDPDAATMQQLISEAHIHILPTFQATGLKLKLLYALFAGRHVLANPAMLHGSGVENLCRVATAPASFKEQVQILMELPFTAEEKEKRINLLDLLYNNRRNAEKIMQHAANRL